VSASAAAGVGGNSQAGDLDVVGAVAGLGQALDHAAQQVGLAEAGRRDQPGAHAALGRAQQAVLGFCELGQVEVVLHPDLPGEGVGVEAVLGA